MQQPADECSLMTHAERKSARDPAGAGRCGAAQRCRCATESGPEQRIRAATAVRGHPQSPIEGHPQSAAARRRSSSIFFLFLHTSTTAGFLLDFPRRAGA
jgi:hypothetical protein